MQLSSSFKAAVGQDALVHAACCAGKKPGFWRDRPVVRTETAERVPPRQHYAYAAVTQVVRWPDSYKLPDPNAAHHWPLPLHAQPRQ